MVITCDDADVCTYLQNILGLRQTGEADIHADTKATAELVQDPTFGLVALQGLAYDSASNTDALYSQEFTFEALGITRNDYLQRILGIRQSGENDIHADTQNAKDILTNGFSGMSATHTAAATAASYGQTIDTNLGANTNGKASISDYLVNILGTRQTGEADIHADVFAIASILQLAGHGGHPTAGLLSALGYPNGSYATPAAQLDAISSALGTLAVSVVNLISDVASVQTTLANVALGIVASWPGTGVSDLAQAIGSWLTGQRTGPGISSLVLGSNITIDPTVVYDRPDGAYGVQLFLDVPASWGLISEVPNVYIPAVARLVQWSPFGDSGTPMPIETEFLTVYPLHADCTRVQIKLGAGVTGYFDWLLLPT